MSKHSGGDGHEEIRIMLPCLLLTLLLRSSAAQFFLPGEIKTDHTWIYVGENITLHCFKKSPFAAEVQFKIKEMKVPSEYVKVINTTYARMDRPATSADDRELVFSCVDPAPIASKIMYIEYRPQRVSQLQIVYYDKTTAFFSWDLGLAKYNYEPDANMNVKRPVTVVTANYTFDNITWYPCPPASTTSREAHTSCQKEIYIAGNLWLRVTVQNMFRADTAEEVFYIDDLNNYVKPKPVEQLAVQLLNSTAVSLTWTVDRSDLGAAITYRHLGSPQAKPQVVEVPIDEAAVVIPLLHPFYTYAVEVRAKPSRGHLSEPVNVTIKMPQDAPASGPVVLKGGYSRSPCFSERQDVYVFFQPVAENDQNGLISNHSAEFHAGSSTWSDWRPVSEGLLVQARIPCKSGLNVTLYASTGVGRSPPSFTSIPPEAAVAELSAEVSKLDLQVRRINASQMLVIWNPAAELPDYNLFLYYCLQMYSSSADCKDPLQFVVLDATAGSYRLDANGTEFQNGRFGFAVITPDGRQSGITFTECIYTVTGTPGNAPDKPVATAGEEYIQLSWQGTRCDGKRVVHGYILQECREAAIAADCNEIHVEGGDTHTYRLENVHPGIKHHVRLAANTSSGRTDFSEPVSAEANPKSGISGLATGDIVGIATGGLIMLMILGSVVFCTCRRRWKEGGKKFKGQVVKRPRPIRNDYPPQLPGRNLNDNADNLRTFISTDIARQLSEDSGVSIGDNGPTLPDSPVEQNSLTESENPDYVDEGSRRPCDSDGTETTSLTVMPAAARTPCTVNSQAISSGVCDAGGGTEEGAVSGTQDEASESQRVGSYILSAVDESMIEASGKSPASLSQQANARLVQSPVLGSAGERMQHDQFVVDNTPLQDDVEGYVRSAIPDDVEGYVRSAVPDDVEGYVRSAVPDDVEGYVRSAVPDDVEGYVRSAVPDDVEGYVRSAVPDDVEGYVGSAVPDDVYPRNVNNIGVFVQCGQQEPPAVADVFGPMTAAGPSVHHHRYLENPPIDTVPPASSHNTTPMTDSVPSTVNSIGAYVQCGQQEPPPVADVFGPTMAPVDTVAIMGTMTFAGPSVHHHRYLENPPVALPPASSHDTTPMTISGPSTNDDDSPAGREEEEEESCRNAPRAHAACTQCQ